MTCFIINSGARKIIKRSIFFMLTTKLYEINTMPDVLRECITSEVRDVGDWDDEYDEDNDDVLQ